MEGAEAVFLAVGTPSRRGDGHADLQYVYAAAERVARAARRSGLVLVTKSTVPVGTGRRIAEIVRRVRPDLDIHVASNPEFLREGNAVGDFMRPGPRGHRRRQRGRLRQVLRRLYRPLYLIETPIVATGIETAELTKYAANAFLATKVTFINEMADLCEKVGADVHDVARGMGLDGRIGRKFLHPGPGYRRLLLPQGHAGAGAHRAGCRRAAAAGGGDGRGERRPQGGDGRTGHRRAGRRRCAARRSACFGLTFKPETDDMRDSPEPGDPAAAGRRPAPGCAPTTRRPGQARQAAAGRGGLRRRRRWTAARDADAVVLLTEWNEFRALAPERLRERDARRCRARPAQRLGPGGDAGGGAALRRHRPALKLAPRQADRARPAQQAGSPGPALATKAVPRLARGLLPGRHDPCSPDRPLCRPRRPGPAAAAARRPQETLPDPRRAVRPHRGDGARGGRRLLRRAQGGDAGHRRRKRLRQIHHRPAADAADRAGCRRA